MKLSILLLSLALTLTQTHAENFDAKAKELAFQVKDFELTPAQMDEMKLDADYFTIGKVEVKPVEISQEELVSLQEDYLADKADKNLGKVIMVVDKLLALGTKIWDIVKKGKPVVTTRFATPVSVLPKTNDPNTVFYEMENWSAPTFKRYRVEFKNLFGMVVVGFTYNVQFQHSGTFNGKGKYITGLTVSASDLSVAWGFNFDADSTLIAITNRGRRDDPLSAATIEIKYKASSVLKEISSSESFHVTGDGKSFKY
ncbi:MAG: hypothetical protein GY909_09685 [Oligoflexia bacterium]|nr:hypothetical protein [Oligoflexia bacterium]